MFRVAVRGWAMAGAAMDGMSSLSVAASITHPRTVDVCQAVRCDRRRGHFCERVLKLDTNAGRSLWLCWPVLVVSWTESEKRF
jgi:hypothetical protein